METRKLDYLCKMESTSKIYETGSNPYYLNTSNTAKEFSFDESTNPNYGLLNTLANFIIIEDEYTIEQIFTEEQLS